MKYIKRLIFITAIVLFLFVNLYAQTIEEVSTKLTSLTKEQLIEVDQSITAIKIKVIEKLTTSLDGKNGQILRQSEVLDSTGKKISGQRIEWTYYPTGEVNEISIIKLDSKDKQISKKVIKHFTDGTQPIVR